MAAIDADEKLEVADEFMRCIRAKSLRWMPKN
jgi:hypothetical protein